MKKSEYIEWMQWKRKREWRDWGRVLIWNVEAFELCAIEAVTEGKYSLLIRTFFLFTVLIDFVSKLYKVIERFGYKNGMKFNSTTAD